MTPTSGVRRDKWRSPDTSGWAAKLCSELERSLAAHKALPRRTDQWVLGYLGLLLVHMQHLSLAILRLSDSARNRRAVKQFEQALADVAALAERVASVAGRIVPPTKRLVAHNTSEEAQVEAQLRTIAVEVGAMTAEISTGRSSKQTLAPTAATSLLTTRSTRRTPASRGLRGKPRATGRAG